MTFAIFTMPNTLKRLVTPDYVVAVQSIPGDTVARVWTVADSAPGASRGYSIVTGTFAATVAAIGAGLVTLPTPDGSQVAIAPRWVTQLEQLAGNTATRVVWAADGESGYATVTGTLAAVSAALAYTPPSGALFGFNQAFNFGHSNGSPINGGAFYSDAIQPTLVQALVYSVNPTQAQVQFVTTLGALQLTMVDAVSVSGYRVLAPSAPIPAIAAGWKQITLAHLAGAGQSILYGLRIET